MQGRAAAKPRPGRIAWECVLTFYQEGLSEILPLGEGTPAAAQGIETSGEYLAPNPHIHVISADGLFSASGKFYQLPRCDEGSRIYLLSLWKRAVSAFAMEKGFITPEMMGKILNWQHTGFSVFAERRVDFKWSDEESVKEMRYLARYIAKPGASLFAASCGAMRAYGLLPLAVRTGKHPRGSG